jgi:hypothetical protein
MLIQTANFCIRPLVIVLFLSVLCMLVPRQIARKTRQPGIRGDVFQFPAGEVVEFIAFPVAKFFDEPYLALRGQSRRPLRFQASVRVMADPDELRLLHQRPLAVQFPRPEVVSVERFQPEQLGFVCEARLAMTGEFRVSARRSFSALPKAACFYPILPVIPFQNP